MVRARIPSCLPRGAQNGAGRGPLDTVMPGTGGPPQQLFARVLSRTRASGSLLTTPHQPNPKVPDPCKFRAGRCADSTAYSRCSRASPHWKLAGPTATPVWVEMAWWAVSSGCEKRWRPCIF
eukprot:5570208-Pyramimonas_sp.AAC.1